GVREIDRHAVEGGHGADLGSERVSHLDDARHLDAVLEGEGGRGEGELARAQDEDALRGQRAITREERVRAGGSHRARALPGGRGGAGARGRSEAGKPGARSGAPGATMSRS